MWETRTISIEIQLPHDIADQAEEVQKVDPEFLSRVVLYGLTRRSIYHHLRDRGEVMGGVPVVPIGEESRVERLTLGDPDVEPIPEEEARRILAENRYHDGGAWADKEGGR